MNEHPDKPNQPAQPPPPFPPRASGEFRQPPGQPRPPTPGLAVASLVLGCLSVIFIILTAIPAIITGHVALNRIRRSKGTLGGSGIAIGGLVLGYLCTFLALPVMAAILIPTVSNVRESARRTIDSSNLRQIGIASLIHAGEHGGHLPPAMLEAEDGERETTIHDVAFLLATRAGLNDGQLWVSESDHANAPGISGPIRVTTRGEDGEYRLDETFAATRVIAFDYVTGLREDMPSSTPIAWTRGLREDGTWDPDGVYGTDGGHVAFLNGTVRFYRAIGGSGNLLARPDGAPTDNSLETLPEGARVAGAGPGSLDGRTRP